MERNQALEILRTINDVYPRFDLTDRKIKALLPQLERMDYERVMAKFSNYMISSPYPPTLADIAAYAPKENKHLEKMKAWEEEAAKVPDETKRQFREKLKQLVMEKNNDV